MITLKVDCIQILNATDHHNRTPQIIKFLINQNITYNDTQYAPLPSLI